VNIGGTSHTGTWRNTPDGGIGIYHGSVPFTEPYGKVVVTLSRGGSTIAQITGESITTTCADNAENWNAWVQGVQASIKINATPSLTLSERVCINGTGANNFEDICHFSCEYGYCPIGACTCTNMGAARVKPNSTEVQGYPLAGENASYSGLCSFDCNLGHCPNTACGTVSALLSIPTVSDFLPPACIAGTGEGNLGGLCDYACGYGFCPISSCNCTAEGPLNPPPPATTTIIGNVAQGQDPTIYSGLCSFACERGYCPTGACVPSTPTPAPGSGSGTVYINGSLWTEPTPKVECEPPCSLVFPPYPVPGTTTISFPPWYVDITYSCLTTQTTTFPDGIVTSFPSFVPVVIPTVISLSEGKLQAHFFALDYQCLIDSMQFKPPGFPCGVVQ
jgi:hypothetical protein